MYKVAVLSISLNPQYWPYMGGMVETARKFFLKGHDVDFFCWTDMKGDIPSQIRQAWQNNGVNLQHYGQHLEHRIQQTLNILPSLKVIPTEPFTWPIPTLKRYHLFLQQKDVLKDYDFIYYVDADMEFVSRVGDEIFGNLVCAPHPGYHLSRKYIAPYEPDKDSKAFIPRLGYVSEVEGKKRFNPFYAAGGFQGGRSDTFIRAMETMKDWIDDDFQNNKIPIWNDESVFNKYLFDACQRGEDITFLTPSYVYPDSLIQQYYIPIIWGRNFVPKIVTLTKPFSLTKEGGQALNQLL